MALVYVKCRKRVKPRLAGNGAGVHVGNVTVHADRSICLSVGRYHRAEYGRGH